MQLRSGQLLITTESDTDDPELLEVLERQFYYPFGLSMKGVWQSTTSPPERYLYNGKELESGLGLEWMDYGARWYDASIGRWGQIDPLAEKAPSWTPYRFGFDNPIKYFDLDGRWEWDANGNLVAQKGDQSYSLAKFLGTSQKMR